VQAKHLPSPKESPITPATRATAIDEAVAGHERLMQRLAEGHAPDFLEIDITMPQAKVLYLLGAAGELHMSELVTRLGVSLSTVSGLVDRIVDHGLATRRDDPADRRQVVVGLTPAGRAFIDNFRELNARQMRELVSVLDDEELDLVRRALAALGRAAVRVVPGDDHPTTRTTVTRTTVTRTTATRKDPA
jgi:DNA-binding MarR family transcriptional regulator